VTFEALFAERNVTRAGRRLGLSQPATSAALARLRLMLGDDLFVRTPRGLEPTARGLELAEPVASALTALRAALDPTAFDPKSTTRVFSLGAVDAVQAVLLPRVAKLLFAEAPRLSLRVFSIDPGSAVASLDSGEADFVLAHIAKVPAHVASRELFPVVPVLVMRKGHPLEGRAPSLDALVEYPFVVVAYQGPPAGPLDAALAKAGKSRHIAMVVGSFLAAAHVLGETDALCILPRPLAGKLARAGTHAFVELPAVMVPSDVRMRLSWAEKNGLSKAFQWFRDLVLRALEETPLTAAPVTKTR
jgi:DNA-binding transcriptional LysR family regulator